MFYDATIFNQNISSWNTSNVLNMERMFMQSTFNQNISSWCVTNILTKPEEFDECSTLLKHPTYLVEHVLNV
jgi:surface protein